MPSLTKEDGNIIHEPKQILEEERFFKEIYQSNGEYSQTGRSGHLQRAVNTWAAFSRPRSQVFTIRTSQPAITT